MQCIELAPYQYQCVSEEATPLLKAYVRIVEIEIMKPTNADRI